MVTTRNNRRRNRNKTKKTNKNNKTKPNKRYTRRKQRGGDPEIVDKYTELKSFRKQFCDLLYPLINLKGKSNNQIKTFIKNLNNFFVENKKLINTLINIDANRRPVLKDVVDFVSIPTVIMDNITNNEIKSKLLLLFYENGGNINAYNRLTGKENAFIRAVENRQVENIRILLDPRYGLSRDNLPDEIKPVFDDIIREPEIQVQQVLEEPIQGEPIREQIVEPVLEPVQEPIREPIQEPIQEPILEPIREPIQEPQQIQEPIQEPVVKLKVPINVPKVGYKLDVAPRFWRYLFESKGIDLFELRERMRSLLSQDEIHKVIYRKGFTPNAWTTCEMVESMFPAYYTKQNPEFQLKTQEQQMDFVNTNTALCIILLLLGIISNTMNDQDYNFIFKGGKSVQFVLSEIKNTSKYISDDIDILITHNENLVYNEWKMRNVAEHISFLIKWFIEGIINISLDLPNTGGKTFGKDIVKISYVHYPDIYRPNIYKYTALCDIGFGKTNENVRPYFEHPQVFRMYNNTLEQEMMFRCPNIEAILDEKLYYYLKFIQFRDVVRRGSAIHEKGYEDMNPESLNFFIQKFKRSIKAIVDGLILQQSGNINQEEQRMLLQFRLNQYNANTNFKEEAIQSILNPNPYEV